MPNIYKMSNAGGFTTLTRYDNMLAGNAAFVPSSYDSIATVTVGSGGASSVTFSSIPSTYQHLQIRFINQLNTQVPLMRLNSDTGTNYTAHTLVGDGSSASAGAGLSRTSMYFNNASGSTASGSFTAHIIDLLDYANTNKYKTMRSLSGYDANGSGIIQMNSGLWLNTAAINSIEFIPSGNSFAQYTHAALYGIKA